MTVHVNLRQGELRPELGPDLVSRAPDGTVLANLVATRDLSGDSYEERVARRLSTERDLHRPVTGSGVSRLSVDAVGYLLDLCVSEWMTRGDVQPLRRAIDLLTAIVEIGV